MSHFIEEYSNLAPDDYCERMIDMHRKLSESGSAWKGSDANGNANRKDYSWFFDKEDMPTRSGLDVETNNILNNAIALYADKYPAFSMQPCHSFAIKVQMTPPKGGFHNFHCEHGAQNGSEFRNLVWMIYLNDTPEGEGQTEFLEQGVKLQPKKGTVVLFPASWTHTHRGNPVYTCDKYIATGWYYLSV